MVSKTSSYFVAAAVTELDDRDSSNGTLFVSKNDLETISIKQGERFVVQLESNPTTGYVWIPVFNESIIKLTSHSFRPWHQGLPGASGNDTFNFTGLSAGQTNLEFLYKRSWEKEIAEQKVFLVEVT